MGSKMLIDAAHPEETRVAVVRGNRIEEFDYESSHRKQLKGNIYLAKVTRVEPSLQAAFVDYGGNRHGFLAFSEIHPDYYQIPMADRQALLREEADDAKRNEEEFDRDARGPRRGRDSAEADGGDDDSRAGEARDGAEAGNGSDDSDGEDSREGPETVDDDSDNGSVDQVGVEDALEEVPERRRSQRRSYKIQEVIKRRQIMLVQVVKEERGNKGAALTSYLSLAGRYCVLMPNTARGGGISRKITDASDRKRLKELTREIEVPEGMGLIVRTAGAQRTKTEIKRDFDYLIRLWESVRDLTLKSTAPTLVYEEGSLIKRAIRDLYTKDVEDVMVEGEAGYREAKDFMKMLMPSHARNVKLHKDTRPLFSRFKVDSQLDSLFSPTVTLQSGGYVVINQTEALVSIDVNSGKATREHNIEDTALKTNLEAADEIARHLRLRDLAGLIVIDFIDMEEKRNNRAVERRMKEALKHDRARIQVGRISHFGLLEMSRQRLRQGMVEGSTRPCPHCEGLGLVRSVSSSALAVLRGIEEHLMSRKAENLTVYCHPEVSTYILNDKRDHLLSLEASHGVSIFLVPRERVRPWECEIERGAERPGLPRREILQAALAAVEEAEDDEEVAPAVAEEVAEAPEQRTSDGEEAMQSEEQRRRRRRRGRRGGRRSREESQQVSAAAAEGEAAPSEHEATEQRAPAASTEDASTEDASIEDASTEDASKEPGMAEAEAAAHQAEATAEAPRKPARRRRAKPAPAEDAAAPSPDEAAAAPAAEPDSEATEAKPKRARKARPRKPKAAELASEASSEAASGAGAEPEPTGGAAGGEAAGGAAASSADSVDTAPEPAGEPQAEPTATAAAEPEPAGEEARGNGATDHHQSGTGQDQAAERQPQPASEQGEAGQQRRWQPPGPTAKPAGPSRSGWWRRRSIFSGE